jgi:DMSO/TMAO reductase YedYZ molybdopterin-dependent catalytic subunit
MIKKYFPVLAILVLVLSIGCTAQTPQNQASDYTINVTGLYNGTITLNQLKTMKAETFDAILVKSTGTEIPSNYTGVNFMDILSEYKVQPEYISFVSEDGYMITLVKDEYDNAYLCYAEKGVQLNQETGGPIKLVIPDQPGKLWITWLKEIKLLDSSNALVVTGKTKVTLVLAPDDIGRFEKKTIQAEFKGENASYTGVPVAAILDRARYADDAKTIKFVAADGYSKELTFQEVYNNDKILITDNMMLVMPGYSTGFWIRDLRRVELS